MDSTPTSPMNLLEAIEIARDNLPPESFDPDDDLTYSQICKKYRPNVRSLRNKDDFDEVSKAIKECTTRIQVAGCLEFLGKRRISEIAFLLRQARQRKCEVYVTLFIKDGYISNFIKYMSDSDIQVEIVGCNIVLSTFIKVGNIVWCF